jgi:hypothetical protein
MNTVKSHLARKYNANTFSVRRKQMGVTFNHISCHQPIAQTVTEAAQAPAAAPGATVVVWAKQIDLHSPLAQPNPLVGQGPGALRWLRAKRHARARRPAVVTSLQVRLAGACASAAGGGARAGEHKSS